MYHRQGLLGQTLQWEPGLGQRRAVVSSQSEEGLEEHRRLQGLCCDRAGRVLAEDARERRVAGVEEVVRDGKQTGAAQQEAAHGELYKWSL